MPASNRSNRTGQASRSSLDSLNESNASEVPTENRRKLLLQMIKALMKYGAPSHRIQEYASVLFKMCDLEGFVNYNMGGTQIFASQLIPPCCPNAANIFQFTNTRDRTTYTELVQEQGLDLGASDAAFRIYKLVTTREMTIDDANERLAALLASPSYYKPWVKVPFYGLSSSFICVWAFGGSWLSMVPSLILGTVSGIFQEILPFRIQNRPILLQISSAVVITFLARAFASIHGGEYFCFDAIGISAVVNILPNYDMLRGVLEMTNPQTMSVGATRLTYTIIYSLFLGYGADIGSQLWRRIDGVDIVCSHSAIDPKLLILMVPVSLVWMAVKIGSRPRQMPAQVLLGSTTFVVQYFVKRFADRNIAVTITAFTLGTLGNLYMRLLDEFAFGAMISGVFILLPSGVSVDGGLSANVLDVLIGLAVGMYLSVLVVYPKYRSHLFCF
ncbi:hypothetical protein PG994_003268 [Apiospora phragmitis]|uniref:Threonine/serine exporter-like N-terminal domain-containing protein n=1 Tax=Apiospora phragmitis TaxID=2905665 RepID=A0ABR1W0B2_9PEZI